MSDYDDGRAGNGPTWSRLHVVPRDVLGVLGYLAVATPGLAVFQPGSLPYLLFVGPLVFLLPGYAVIAAVFPATSDERSRAAPLVSGSVRTPSWGGRLTLSVLCSLLCLPLAGGLLVLSGGGFTPERVAFVLGAGTVLGLAVSVVRRRSLPPPDRLGLPIERWRHSVTDDWIRTNSPTAIVASIALVGAVLLLFASVSMAMGAPAGGESFTSLTLLAENESGGYEAAGYPTEVTVHERVPFAVDVTNREGQRTSYTLVVRLGGNETGDPGAVSREVTRRSITLQPGTTVREEFAVTPRRVGDGRRLEVSLYRGVDATDPDLGEAYRRTSLAMNVTEPIGG